MKYYYHYNNINLIFVWLYCLIYACILHYLYLIYLYLLFLISINFFSLPLSIILTNVFFFRNFAGTNRSYRSVFATIKITKMFVLNLLEKFKLLNMWYFIICLVVQMKLKSSNFLKKDKTKMDVFKPYQIDKMGIVRDDDNIVHNFRKWTNWDKNLIMNKKEKSRDDFLVLIYCFYIYNIIIVLQKLTFFFIFFVYFRLLKKKLN